MVLFSEDYLFHHIDITKKPQCQYIKFERAFRFLRLFLIQRIYGIDLLTHSSIRRALKHPPQPCDFDVFLGGSCNPTTWRYEQAIPYFQSRTISYYNPQVPNWTPDLVEIEYRAKELASLLFFVIDHSTRSLAAIAEVAYLAARRRDLIIVMNHMPEERNQSKFLQQKTSANENDNKNDYENVCAARRTLRRLVRSINIPVFDDIRVALECAAFLIRNPVSNDCHSRPTSCLTIETDDEGYGSSLASSNRTFSRSSSPASSDCEEYTSHDNSPFKFHLTVLQSIFNLCTSPIRFLTNLLTPSLTNQLGHSSPALFDLYIASGDHEEDWLNNIVLPFLQQNNLTYAKREMSDEEDQFDIRIRKRSRLLYYLIDDNDRLSQLITELAFLIGERQYRIIVYLQSIIQENSKEIRSQNERQDIERSRKYLADLARKENISLYHCREQSWQHVFNVLS